MLQKCYILIFNRAYYLILISQSSLYSHHIWNHYTFHFQDTLVFKSIRRIILHNKKKKVLRISYSCRHPLIMPEIIEQFN